MEREKISYWKERFHFIYIKQKLDFEKTIGSNIIPDGSRIILGRAISDAG